MMSDDCKQMVFDVCFVKDETFYAFPDDPRSAVLELSPKVFPDSRGWFSEVLKGDLNWVKQINRSSSKAGVIRGCHAQKGTTSQAKLVEALTEVVFDFIIDARPDSESFGVSKIYRLDPVKQNKLFVPRGFLHAIIIPFTAKGNAIFNYYCDNTYCKEAEICINPRSIIPRNLGILRSWCLDNENMKADYGEAIEGNDDDRIYSEKDLQGLDYDTWMTMLKIAHDKGDLETSLWYK